MLPKHSQEITFGILNAGGFIPTTGKDLATIRAKYCIFDMIFMPLELG